ncbi:hypothetical protein TNIN_34781 [Trichonephila inaurata madagascariensis]|uniref:Uncharacterized protein n=1 Tax=Trichonephila inaurata madagascariensis TaxID=2747483 RepID=A0A8X6WYL6_9ARAC|nr:hypothetical protein TNIN_34781 [Trichonephila inaurata madagascariensis]
MSHRDTEARHTLNCSRHPIMFPTSCGIGIQPTPLIYKSPSTTSFNIKNKKEFPHVMQMNELVAGKKIQPEVVGFENWEPFGSEDFKVCARLE